MFVAAKVPARDDLPLEFGVTFCQLLRESGAHGNIR